MELLGVIVALETLKIPGSDVTIYSDSKYVIDSIQKGWLQSWVRTGFKKKKNVDLWQRYLAICKNHHLRFVWVKGHNNNKENEVCDKLAVNASFMKELLVDEGYERLKEDDTEFLI